MAGGGGGLSRKHGDPACEACRPVLAGGHGAHGLGPPPARPHPALQVHRRRRTVGDAGRLPARDPGRAGQAQYPGEGDPGPGPRGLHSYGDPDDVCISRFRSKTDLGPKMSDEQIPKARIRRRRLFRLVWVVPAIALVVASWLVWQHMRAIGPEIKIRFADASGLRVGQTPINYRGVQVGEVSGIELTEDRRQAVVRVRLIKSAAPLATEGSQFWIVRPQIGLNQVTGLSTVLSGPEINVLPGKGEE